MFTLPSVGLLRSLQSYEVVTFDSLLSSRPQACQENSSAIKPKVKFHCSPSQTMSGSLQVPVSPFILYSIVVFPICSSIRAVCPCSGLVQAGKPADRLSNARGRARKSAARGGRRILTPVMYQIILL